MKKSIKLNISMRDEIIANVMKCWDAENEAPYIKDELDKELADAYYADCFKSITPQLQELPEAVKKFLYAGDTFYVQIGDSSGYTPVYMSDIRPLPVACHRHRRSPVKLYEKKPRFLLSHEKKTQTLDKWRDDRDSWRQEIRQIVYSVNTTKQLSELWPECVQFFPDYLLDPSQAIKLPALDSARLNKKLGIK